MTAKSEAWVSWFSSNHLGLHLGKFLAPSPENLHNTTLKKKYERKTDSKLNSYIDFWWFFTTTKNQPTQVKSMFSATFRVSLPPKFFFFLSILILRENAFFSKCEMLCSGFRIGYERYTMSLLYTFKEFHPKTS